MFRRGLFRRSAIACLLGAATMTACAWAAEPAAVRELSQHRRSGVVSAWLENGVRLHYRPMGQPAGQVVLTLCLFGGELLEDEATRGLSRLTIAALDDALAPATAPESIRGSLGERDVHVDGIAAPDALMLRVWGSADDVAHGARVIGEALRHLEVDAARLDRARSALAAMSDKPAQRAAMLVGESIVELIYPAADPRTRPVRAEELARFTPEEVRAWLERHTDTAPVEAAVVGALSLEQSLTIARQVVGELPPRQRVTPCVIGGMHRLPPPAGPLERTIAAQTPESRALTVAGFLGIDLSNAEQVRTFRAAGRVLQARVRERLEDAGVTRSAADCDAGVWLSPDPGYGMLVLLASVDPARPHDAYIVLNDEVDRLAAHGPTADELSNAAEALAVDGDKANREDARYWSGMLARSTALDLEPDEVFAGPQFYRSLTADMVTRAVRERWTPEARIGLVIRPAEQPAAVK